MAIKGNYVWIFHGVSGRFSSGVFSEREIANSWIKENKLTGVLTQYPVDKGVFDWAVSEGLFKPEADKHASSEFIGSFSSASQNHFHYENGVSEEDEESEIEIPRQ